ncbi:MAG: Ig-like domain-containing protein [Desulfuromonadaceae bacterium]|nr:Ig-like domain-containing protein [Desulfuromonadaceae bacterium]
MNTRLMRLLLYLSFILVTGCSGPDPSGTNISSNSTGNSVIFNPSSGEIPLPNVLATAMAKSPLTNSMSAGDPVVRPANTPMTPPEALSYINYYEVGSTSAVSGVNAPIYIRFSSPVDAATVTAANIKVFQIAADSTSSSATENNPLGFTDVTGMFTLRYSAGSTDLFMFPNFPMSPATRYLYVVSNRVKDAATGNPVVSSPYFEILKSTFPLVGAFAALEPIRANAMSGASIKLSGYAKVMDDLITAAKVASRSEIAVMGRFITTGAGFVSKDAIGTMMPVESALRSFAAGATLGGLTGKTWVNAVTVTTPAGLTPAAYWAAAAAGTAPTSVGAVVTGTINSARLSMDPVVAKANAAAAGGDLTAVSGAYNPAAGVLQPFRDGTGALTAYYHATTAVPFILITPTTPSGKVIIFQHGISGQKEQVVAVAGSLTAAGYTVVAIDLPLHGALAVPTHTTGAVWGQDFMAVGAPLATRSNIQQAAFNLNRLELTMRTGGFAAQGIVPSPAVEIKYVSLSLGSIVGAYYLAGNTTLSTTGYPYTQTTLNSDMKGFLSVPGGRLAYLLQNSPAFGPSINAGLAAVGIAAGTPTYNNFMQVTQSVVDSVDPATMTTPLAAGLPSRLSGRIAIQEAVGDQVIPNDNTRYFGNALGGREVVGSAGNAVAPGFKQLSYSVASRIPSSFMYTLTGGVPAPKTGSAAVNGSGSAIPSEGYFQFDQVGINHGFLIDPRASVANTTFAQSQMVQFLLYGGIVDPTEVSVAKRAFAAEIPAISNDVSLPPVLKIFGY